MQFASYVFLFHFLPAFLLLYWAVPVLTKQWVDQRRTRSLLIAAASYAFYGWWRPDFVWLMLVSSLTDFYAGRGIGLARDRGGRGRGYLLLSLGVNLGLLAYFKYANFGIETFNALAASLGVSGVENWSKVILPVGISFYTFQTMSYTIDVYRGVVKPLPPSRFVDFLCYVALFPQLVAGPIVRYKEIEAELEDRRHKLQDFYRGVLMFQCGLAKKLLLADMLHPVAEAAFQGQALSAGDSWIGALAFTFQLYFDFSGYSDMAIGLGLMLGFHFPVNFSSPYKSGSIAEFWRRWHISLSAFLRDYLYIPLGGNRRGPVRTYINLMATMLLGGLWHGANWTFLVWGAYHGGLLGLERRGGKGPVYRFAPRPLRILATLLLVIVGWVIFKSPDLPAAGQYLACMAGAGPVPSAPLDFRLLPTLVLSIAAAVALFAPASQMLAMRDRLPWVLLLQFLFVLSVAELFRKDHVPFLYTQF